ncbi:MAG TPA: Gldg family protein [Chloroflexota bacterium]|nr:Gldg family protein [Chloroflexota bacterium]
MTLRTFLSNTVARLSAILLIVGVVALVGAIGVYLVDGQLDRPVVVLLAIGLGFIVYAALERPENTAQTLTSRGVRYGSNTLVMSVAFVGILALVNILGNRYSTRLDLTQNKLYTLSPLSLQVEGELQQPVHAIAFYSKSQGGQDTFEPLLKEYAAHSSLFTYEFVDPQLKPSLANQYKVQFPGTTVLVSGTKFQTVTGSDEGALTSGLLKLVRTKAEIAYYLTGHGEIDLAGTAQDGGSTVKTSLESQNYTVTPLNLAATAKVPADASLLIVAGPTAALLPAEVTALESYIDSGGKVLFLVDKRQRPILEPIAERYGVEIGNGIVIEPTQSLPNDPVVPLINHFQSSPITKDLPQLLFLAATSVTPLKTPPAGVQVQSLAQTTSDSWLETDTQQIHFDPGVDPVGPLTVAVSVTKAGATANDASAYRLVFIGDVAFASNGMMQQYSALNGTLLTNVADWLTSNEDLIQVQAKVPTDQTMTLSTTQLNLIGVTAALLPLLVITIGAVVWWKRR